MSTAVHPVWLRCFQGARGVFAACRAAWEQALRGVVPARRLRHPFDRRHGVDTSGLLYPADLPSAHVHDIHSAGYYATAPSLFHGAMARWSETLPGSGHRLSDYTLVDIGCGKGRVVMLASEYAFREVVGVELNPELAAVAQRNLTKWMRSPRACRAVRVLHGDTLSIPIPRGPVVLYFFNSFERGMVELWLDRLSGVASARTGPIDLIYVHPEFGELIGRTPGMQMLSEAEVAFSAEDADADVFGVSFDRCAIFRMPGRLR